MVYRSPLLARVKVIQYPDLSMPTHGKVHYIRVEDPFSLSPPPVQLMKALEDSVDFRKASIAMAHKKDCPEFS